ncbi:MAG: glycosyltransferase [Candidatus Nanopelagicales bacterium]|nr:glycosyltransferase [Candidatus Nanopelagicales bacterium]
MNDAPWLTVVTVVKDDAAGLTRSLQSLRDQDLAGVEYLVIDSSDDAHEVPALLSALAEVPSTCTWQAPQGIYAAMNAGVAAATGEYVYFLNAGDALASPHVLAQVRASVRTDRPSWLFGHVEIVQANGTTVVTPRWNYREHQRSGFSRGHFPPHQATFARTSFIRDLGGFDTEYRIAADYALFLRMARDSDPLLLDLVIASFQEGGASTLQWQQSFREFHQARTSLLGLRGSARLAEQFNTVEHFARVWLVRELLPRVGVRR